MLSPSIATTGTFNRKGFLNSSISYNDAEEAEIIIELSDDSISSAGLKHVYDKESDKWKYEGKSFKETDELKGLKTVDFAIGLGLTYNIADEVFVQGRYTLGMTKLLDGINTKNGNGQIAIGYRF